MRAHPQIIDSNADYFRLYRSGLKISTRRAEHSEQEQLLFMDELNPSQRRKFTGRTCNLHPDPVTSHAIGLALRRAEASLANGSLLSPTEAMALALHEAREKDTLFSLARKIAGETGGNQDDILCRLGERFPEYA